MTTARTASGRFVATRAVVPKPVRSASERLQLVKLGIKAIERERDEATAEWHRSLLDEDAGAVERCERQLDVLEWKLRRSQALIDLLPPLVAREQQQRPQHPTDEPSAQARLLEIEPWIVRWQAVPEVDRSARFQADLDGLINERYRLLRLIESFAPRKMVAT